MPDINDTITRNYRKKSIWLYTDSPIVPGLPSKCLGSFEPNTKLVPAEDQTTV